MCQYVHKYIHFHLNISSRIFKDIEVQLDIHHIKKLYTIFMLSSAISISKHILQIWISIMVVVVEPHIDYLQNQQKIRTLPPTEYTSLSAAVARNVFSEYPFLFCGCLLWLSCI